VADVSVRAARAEDVSEIARIQVDTWRSAYTSVLPEPVLADLSVDAAQRAWRTAIEEPPTEYHHVLVAQEQRWVVGFAALRPVDETEVGLPDARSSTNLGPLIVEPRWGRRGHGSRLLAAAVDHARADGVTHMITWVPSGDGPSLSFFRSAGWATDGYARGLETGAGEVRELRLHVSLETAP